MRLVNWKAVLVAAFIIAIMMIIPAPKANAMDEQLRTPESEIATGENYMTYKTSEGLYATTGIVTEINGNEITFVDFSGNEWSFYSEADDWNTGDRVACVMDDNKTEIIYDDIITAVKYCGWEY